MNKANYKRLGDYIQPVNIRNKDLQVERLLGVSIQKVLMPSIANTVGTNMKTYKIIKQNQFAYGPVTSRNGDKISIALLQDFDEAIISQAYTVFEIIDTEILNPEYLMMWFRRPEFDRYARFKSHGSARETFDWEEMLETELPIPTIEKQKAIVKEYNTVVNRIKLNEQLNQKLEETAQAIYKHWFVDFEFNCLPENYKFSGAVKPDDFDSLMTYKRVGGLPVPDGKIWFVYIIECLPSSKDGQVSQDRTFYKGMTNDLYRRFYEHYTGKGADWTKTHKPVRVIHWEKFNSQTEARNREEELKTGFGRTWIKREYDKFKKYGFIAKTGLPAHQTRLMMAGKMVYNEVLDKDIPEGWCDGKLSYFIEVKYGKDHKHLKDGAYPLYGSGGIMRFVEKPLYTEKSILIPRKGSLKNIMYIDHPFWSVDTMFFSHLKEKYYGKYTFFFLKTIDIQALNVGSAVPSMTTAILNDITIIIPNNIILIKFEKLIDTIFVEENKNRIQIDKLQQFLDLLLSKMTKI